MIPAHSQPCDESREWAALYALGALPPAERVEFDEHLRTGCATCEAELQGFGGVVGTLAFAAPPENPPTGLRNLLTTRLAEARRTILLNDRGFLIARGANIPWQPAAAGITSKPLFADQERKQTFALVRLEPGTVYPSHRHADVEHVYVLEGDLLVESVLMRPGDYCRAEPNTVHGEVRTLAGALLLVLSSDQDEILA